MDAPNESFSTAESDCGVTHDPMSQPQTCPTCAIDVQERDEAEVRPSREVLQARIDAVCKRLTRVEGELGKEHLDILRDKSLDAQEKLNRVCAVVGGYQGHLSLTIERLRPPTEEDSGNES